MQVHEVFGAGSLWWRCVPSAMELPDRVKDDILGYALPMSLKPTSDTEGGDGGGTSSMSPRGGGGGEASGDGSSEASGSSSAEGSSSEGSGSESESEAIARCRPLAEGGDAQAMLHLAVMYDEGRVAVRNTQRARRWLRRAAAGVNAEAAFRLGQYHEQGLGGLQPSAARAKQFYTDAAAQGDRMAAMALDRLGGWLDGDDDGDARSAAKGRSSSATTSDDDVVSSSSSSGGGGGGSGVPSGRDAAVPRARRPLGSSAAS